MYRIVHNEYGIKHRKNGPCFEAAERADQLLGEGDMAGADDVVLVTLRSL